MKTLVIVGDPNSIAGMLNVIYKNNPKLKVVTATAAQHFFTPPQKVIPIAGQPQGQAIPCNAYYLTFEGVETIVDDKGKPVEGVN